MMIGVLATDEQWKEIRESACLVRLSSLENDSPDLIDAFIVLTDVDTQCFKGIKKTILLNSVVRTLQELKTDSNVLRINGWPGFLSRNTWEVAGIINKDVQEIFSQISKGFIQ